MKRQQLRRHLHPKRRLPTQPNQSRSPQDYSRTRPKAQQTTTGRYKANKRIYWNQSKLQVTHSLRWRGLATRWLKILKRVSWIEITLTKVSEWTTWVKTRDIRISKGWIVSLDRNICLCCKVCLRIAIWVSPNQSQLLSPNSPPSLSLHLLIQRREIIKSS